MSCPGSFPSTQGTGLTDSTEFTEFLLTCNVIIALGVMVFPDY